MEQFFIVAAVHFLALLSPGPDFFLVARTSLSSGWRIASGACLGIAIANGVFIIGAFAGTAALHPDSSAFVVLQLLGCAYLLYLGVLFIRYAGVNGVEGSAVAPRRADDRAQQHIAWWRAAGMGFLSGILNPKNALFYASLAAMLTGAHTSIGWKFFYGAWMFSIVLLWDLLVAVLVGNQAVLRRFAHALPWLERCTGGVLIALALGVIAVLLTR